MRKLVYRTGGGFYSSYECFNSFRELLQYLSSVMGCDTKYIAFVPYSDDKRISPLSGVAVGITLLVVYKNRGFGFLTFENIKIMKK